MGEIERVHLFLTDVEELLRMRDSHFRQLRALKVEADMLNRFSLENRFDAEREKYLSDQKALRAQIDEYLRGTERMLFLLTGTDSIDNVRRLATEIQVALSKVEETTRRFAEAKVDRELYKDTDNAELKTALEKDYEISEMVMNRAWDYVQSLIPKNYSPSASLA